MGDQGGLSAHLIPFGAIVQIRTALRLPPAIRGVLMPDAHYGYALPVGGVVAYDRAVAPFMPRSATGRPSALVYGKHKKTTSPNVLVVLGTCGG